MKLILLSIPLFLFAINGECSDPEKSKTEYFMGFSGGVSQHVTFSGSIYGGFTYLFNDKTCEVSLGYNYFENNTDFDDVKNLSYLSHGLYGEVNYFFTSKIYAGVGLSLNMNFIDEDSQEKYMDESVKDPPEIFPGKKVYAQLGLNQKVYKNMSLRIQSQFGLHNFQIETGTVYFSNDQSPVPIQFQDQYAKELQLKLLYNISIGLNVRF